MGHLFGNFMVGLMVTFSKRSYATGYVTQVAVPRTPAPVKATSDSLHRRVKCRSVSVSVGIEPSKYLWRVWGLSLNMISPSPYHFSGASPLLLDVGYLFLVRSIIFLSMVVQQQVVILEKMRRWEDLLTWEDECTSFYSAILLLILSTSDFFIEVSSMNLQKWLLLPTELITDTVDNLMYCCCLFYFSCISQGG